MYATAAPDVHKLGFVVRALNLTVLLGSGRVGSDDLGYGPGSGFSFEPVQTSKPDGGLQSTLGR